MSKVEVTRKRLTLRSSEVQQIARDLTRLGLTHVKQDGILNVRQRESLRRTLAEAGHALAWDVKAATSADAMADVSRDMKKLVESGAKKLKTEVKDELKSKKTEEKKLEQVVESLRELVEASDDSFPTEVTYTHTARDITQGLFTHTETVELADTGEVEETLKTMEKSLRRWEKLRTQMLEELQGTDKRLTVLSGDVGSFVESSQRLLRELLQTLD